MLCFKKFPLAKRFGRTRGSIRKLRRVFLSHTAEIIRRGTLLCCISENCRLQKSLDKRVGEYQDFLSKIFCPTVPKKFVEGTFSAVFQKNFPLTKNLWIRREGENLNLFLGKFFVPQCRKVP